MNQPRTKRHRVLSGGAIALLVVLAGSLVAWKVHTASQQVTCGVTLSKAWHIVFSMYSSDHPDKKYPPMSTVPGQLFLEQSDVHPRYASDKDHPLFCAASDRAFKGLPMEEKFTNSTYVYFGYVLQKEDELLAFLDAYPDFIEQGVDFKSDLPAPKGRGSFGGDQFIRLAQDHRPDGTTEALRIPVIIEIPNYTDDGYEFRHPKPGGNVSFLGEGAGFLAYGEKFPMTETVIGKIGEIKRQYK